MKSNISLQKVDELLAEVDVARTLAREAVARAEKTLAEANETLQILLGRCWFLFIAPNGLKLSRIIRSVHCLY